MPVIGDRVSVSVKNILLATDFSSASLAATSYAKELARRFSSVVELAHVVVPTYATVAGEAWVPIAGAAHQLLLDEKKMILLQEEFSKIGIEARINLPEGPDIDNELLTIAKNHQIEMIVAGTQSKPAVEQFFLGSTAENLIRQAACPVVTVGPHVKTVENTPLVFQNIIYATDLTSDAAKAAVYALSFAQDSGAHLYFCYVLGDSIPDFATRTALEQDFQAKLRRMIPESSYDWCSPECVVEHGAAATGILSLAQRVNADLIVLGARKTSFWLRHIDRGLTPELLAQASCPVMTVC